MAPLTRLVKEGIVAVIATGWFVLIFGVLGKIKGVDEGFPGR